jgi:hypothetical protein
MVLLYALQLRDHVSQPYKESFTNKTLCIATRTFYVSVFGNMMGLVYVEVILRRKHRSEEAGSKSVLG